jgi:DNA-binding CsgD family transcriptional regulator
MAEALRDLLRDVDKVTISINARCDLSDPENYSPDVAVVQHLADTAPSVRSAIVEGATNGRIEDADHEQRLVAALVRDKFPLDSYHPPQSFVYRYRQVAYLGIIILWRDKHRPPISEETLRTMRALHRFIGFLLSDFVARYAATNPLFRIFNDALEELASATGLSRQERRVLLQLLYGGSQNEAAEALHISRVTVRHHLKNIYRKTGTKNLSDLFAHYFVPRLVPPAMQRDHEERGKGS